jgi:hypothetical protein
VFENRAVRCRAACVRSANSARWSDTGATLISERAEFGRVGAAEPPPRDSLVLQPLDIAPDRHLRDVEFLGERSEIELAGRQ